MSILPHLLWIYRVGSTGSVAAVEPVAPCFLGKVAAVLDESCKFGESRGLFTRIKKKKKKKRNA